jgi:hypothetical protein
VSSRFTSFWLELDIWVVRINRLTPEDANHGNKKGAVSGARMATCMVIRRDHAGRVSFNRSIEIAGACDSPRQLNQHTSQSVLPMDFGVHSV